MHTRIALVLVSLGCADDASSRFPAERAISPPSGPITSVSDDGGSVLVQKNEGKFVPPAEVFGHSASQLFKLDPDTKAVAVVGTFSGCEGGVIDIALNEHAELFATSQTAVHRVDKRTGVCTVIGHGRFPNSLSFVPRGALSETEEVLVGYSDSDYVRIDPRTGSVTVVGSIGAEYTSSGDIVSVMGGPTFLTVRKSACRAPCRDLLVEVNPTTGQLMKVWGELPFPKVFGLAFWAGSLYAFDDAGDLFEVTPQGAGIVSRSISIPGNLPSPLSFWGAGSATSAPTLPK